MYNLFVSFVKAGEDVNDLSNYCYYVRCIDLHSSKLIKYKKVTEAEIEEIVDNMLNTDWFGRTVEDVNNQGYDKIGSKVYSNFDTCTLGKHLTWEAPMYAKDYKYFLK